ncbi:hypothetical protein D6_0172 [Aeromonas phage D6]|uniref:Uncharacterized protein n=1 Tax=Aeromonas phage D6 TaxID=2593322 RepID=A0A514TWD0_9CAUD|nr:hypothetical protein PQC08_gp103 [Aeromonas phage D6]QDJ97331.1 hypothetical protein D6_0172 [Aeromonas phage D6]
MAKTFRKADTISSNYPLYAVVNADAKSTKNLTVFPQQLVQKLSQWKYMRITQVGDRVIFFFTDKKSALDFDLSAGRILVNLDKMSSSGRDWHEYLVDSIQGKVTFESNYGIDDIMDMVKVIRPDLGGDTETILRILDK